MKHTFFGYTPVIMQQFTEMIKSYTGLQVRQQDISLLWSKIQTRMKALKLVSPEQYYQRLANSLNSENVDLVQSNHEWQQFIQLLTTGESYFFRDQGQFRLLQQHILPDLIRSRSQQALINKTKPSLRLWSAGCSTGEEAYSLAILVHELIPDLSNWNLLILGTDINAEAIAKARKGIYHSWSFRTLNKDLQSKYFHAHRKQWKLNEQICNMVTFRTSNLVKNCFSISGLDSSNIDLIICRNVFIYFTPEIIASVLEKFSKTLSPGGYLITGHAELHNQNLGQLHTKVFPESFVYHRSDQVMAVNSHRVADRSEEFAKPQTTTQIDVAKVLPEIVPSVILPQLHTDALCEAKKSFCRGEYITAIQIAEGAIVQEIQSFDLHYLLAQSYANLEKLDQAKYYCEKALEIKALSTSPYYLLAHIAREQKQFNQAKDLLKRIIYLDPAAITAYLELSSLYTQEGDATRAKKMQIIAVDLMQHSSLKP